MKASVIIPAEKENENLRRCLKALGRQTFKEKIQFYYIAHGSLTELLNQLIIAKDIGYLGKEFFDPMMSRVEEVSKLLHGLIKKSKEVLNS